VNDFVRVCPVCGAERPPEDSQCACGTLLIGIDLTRPGQAAAPTAAPAAAPAAAPEPAAGTACPHADCGAVNPPGHDSCVYCGRPLAGAAGSPPGPMPQPGLYNLPSALAVNFAIDRVLPAGGAEAELMLLKGQKTGVRVMAKLYRPGIAPKGEVLERVGKIAHAHVVRLLAHGVSDGVAYEVMEYCAGGSLRDLMGQEPLPTERLRPILAEIAAALAALHDCRVIHRDLKPENVLVRRREPLDLVLTDFGIASLQDATQLFTGTARTARYGAPEAITGVLDQAADYWSLGMMLVEMLLGRHPFAGLSDPVVAHRLATAGVDTSAIPDPAWRRLCRGLLQREPGQRWGADEIRRWLADDPTLPEPAEAAPPLAHGYRIEGEECRSRPELAAAFSRHWQAARKDLSRGQFETWVRQDLKDHDLGRFLHDLKERGGSPDLHLFRLIRHLSPAIPPSWRGEPLAPAALLAQAARATAGDEAAADWLHALFSERVLELLPADQHSDLMALLDPWRQSWQTFGELWREADEALGAWRQGRVARGEAVPDYDALVFGTGGNLRRPSPGQVLAPLLLVREQPGYGEDLGTRVLAEAAAHLEHSPWLEALCRRAEGKDETGRVARVVLLHLLPQARTASEEGQKLAEGRKAEQAGQLASLTRQVSESLAGLRATAEDLGLIFAEAGQQRLAEQIDTFLALSLEARGLVQGSDAAGNGAWRTLARAEPLVLGMRDRLEEWRSSSRINALWRNRQVLNAAGIVLFVVFLAAPAWLPAVLGLPVLFAGWRLWIAADHRRAIRRLAAGLPLRITALAAS